MKKARKPKAKAKAKGKAAAGKAAAGKKTLKKVAATADLAIEEAEEAPAEAFSRNPDNIVCAGTSPQTLTMKSLPRPVKRNLIMRRKQKALPKMLPKSPATMKRKFCWTWVSWRIGRSRRFSGYIFLHLFSLPHSLSSLLSRICIPHRAPHPLQNPGSQNK